MKASLIVALSVFVSLFSIASAALPNYISSYSAFQSWFPIILIGLVLGILIVAVYYMAGVLLNNPRVKARAVGEFGQVIGTGIIVVAILAVFALVGTGQLSISSLLAPSSISTVCGQLSNQQINGQPNPYAPKLSMLNANSFYKSAGVVTPTPTNAICSAVDALASGTSGADPTPVIDYGLFSSYVILANLTNQVSFNLDAFYVFSGWIGFLSSFTAITTVCSPITCLIPGVPGTGVSFSYAPLAGYSSITRIMEPAQYESVLTFYILLLQLLYVTLLLFAWPYFLAAGILLQTTFFTRKIGGLLIALSIAGVLIAPIIYAMEYTAFSGQTLSVIGANNLPTMPLYEQPLVGNAIVYGELSGSGYVGGPLTPAPGCSAAQPYIWEQVCGFSGTDVPPCLSTITGGYCPPPAITKPTSDWNVFVLPHADQVIRYFNCMPTDLVTNEAEFSAFYLIPGYSAIIGGVGALVGTVPGTPLLLQPGQPLYFNGCSPNNAINAALALTNLYGIIFVAGVMLPLINVILALGAALGLWVLLGGDKDIVGISKLV